MKPKRPAWEIRYARKLLWTDVGALTIALPATQLFGLSLNEGSGLSAAPDSPHALSTALFLTAFAVICLVALNITDTRNPTVFGSGPEEYKRVSIAVLFSFGLFSILVLFLSPTMPRRLPYLLTFALTFLLVLLGRWMWRKRLHSQRRKQRHTYRTIVMGEENHTLQTLRQLRRNTLAGFEVVGIISGKNPSKKLQKAATVLGRYKDVLRVVDEHDIDTLIITSANSLTPKKIRRISWQLEERNVDLIVTANLTDVAGPRLHIRPVSGLPLIHMEYPEFKGWRYFVKQLSDILGAILLIAFTALPMLALAIAIRIDSPGPAIFRQTRLGRDGKPFTMYKFRTMREGAEIELPSMLDQSEVDSVLFKVRSDPRVTRIGRFMRRHSLDELPQLFNVLRGDMSLIGPRPPLPHEVNQYKSWEHRRLLTLPGMSGLWQVSGRSDLSWEESVRLDLLYVENWSFTGDLLILWRTLRAVIKPVGAY